MKIYREFKKQLLRTVIAGALLGMSAGAYASDPTIATLTLATKGLPKITVESNCPEVFELPSTCDSDVSCTLSPNSSIQATFDPIPSVDVENYCDGKTASLTFQDSASKKLATVDYGPDAGKGDLLSVSYRAPSIAIMWNDSSIMLLPK